MTPARWGLVATTVVLLATSAADAGDPTLVHKTLESDHFILYYPEPLDDVARRVALVAERAHRTLSAALDHRPDEKTIIVLVDETDSANGFAGVLPRNAIQLFATAPAAISELEDHDDWLYGLTAHEYTHVLHLDTMSGLPTIYNRVFGKTWSPNQIMPRWVIEGIATYEESKRSSGGRSRGTRFDQVIRIARHAGKQLRLDEVSGAPRQYPRGNAAYVYGSHFLRYVFDRFGDDTLRKMGHAGGEFPIPFAVNRQIAKVVGKPFPELYDDWNGYLRDRYGMQEMAAERRGLVPGRQLTHTAESNSSAQYSADGNHIVWVQYDGYRQPVVRSMPVGKDAAAARDVVQIDAIGPFDLLDDGSLIYEQGRLFRREYAFQDLFRWDAATGETIRLTTGRRARDPSVSQDGRRIAFSMNEHSESVLAVMDAAPGAPAAVIWRGQRYDQAYQPAWSPDGTRVAFSAWRRGGYRDILVVDVATKQVQEITADRALDMSPEWSHDGRWIYFDSDRSGIQNIYAYDTVEQTTWQVTNVLGGAFRPRLAPGDRRMVFEAAVPAGGYDLFELELDHTTWLAANDYVDDRPPSVDVRDDEAKVSEPRPYRPIETLAPRVWTGTLQLAPEPSATLQTQGNDAVGLHSYALALSTPFERGDLNIAASYGYGGFRPAIRVAMARTLVDRGGYRIAGNNYAFREEDWSATLASSIPFESRPGSSWTLSFNYDIDWFRSVDQPMAVLDPTERVPFAPPVDYVQAGIGTRVGYSRTRGVTFGLGPQSGFDAAVALRFDHPALGATYHNVTVSYSLNVFQRLWGETPVLSARLAGALRAGDLVRTGAYALGGVPPQDVVRSIIESTRAGATGYLRGFPIRTVVGNQYHLLNLEYRQELWRIERGLATLPVYLRRLHFAALSDVGTAFDTTFRTSDHLRASVGGALRLDAFFGYFVPGTFEIGYSRGVTTGGIGESWFLLTGSL